MKKENLLSIGALSKQTGVHIKSLRYYDSLGILRPAYVDPSSGYRYYSLQQIPVVDAIQLCVDLDIPLKQFTDYCMDGGSRIHYGKLIERGTILAKEKIQAIQERLVKLDKMRSEIQRSELIQRSDAMVRCSFPTMNLLLAPYPENDTETKVLALFHWGKLHFPGKAVAAHFADLAGELYFAILQRAHNGEEDGVAARPEGWVARPNILLAFAVPQGDQFPAFCLGSGTQFALFQFKCHVAASFL